MRSRIAVVLCASLVAASVARAQEAPDHEPASLITAPASDEAGLAAQLYDLAFEALAQGDRAQAALLLTQLRTQYPQHRLATEAGEILAALGRARPLPSAPPSAAGVVGVTPAALPASPPPPDEQLTAQHTSAARAELVFFQTLHGAALGAEVCAAAECSGPRAVVLSLMAGAGLGAGLSLHLSRNGLTPGLSRALTAGTEWGAWNALMIGLGSDSFNSGAHRERSIGVTMALGQLAGLGLAGLLYDRLTPSVGQVSLTSSGGIWLTTALGLSEVLLDFQISDRTRMWTFLIASDAGLLLGGYLASRLPMSASRVLLLDAGGVLGVLFGAGLAVLVQGGDPNGQVVAGAGLLGLGLGLGLAYRFTRDWDRGPIGQQESALHLGIAPTPGGALASARFVF